MGDPRHRIIKSFSAVCDAYQTARKKLRKLEKDGTLDEVMAVLDGCNPQLDEFMAALAEVSMHLDAAENGEQTRH